jgi:hypothetical protein
MQQSSSRGMLEKYLAIIVRCEKDGGWKEARRESNNGWLSTNHTQVWLAEAPGNAEAKRERENGPRR